MVITKRGGGSRTRHLMTTAAFFCNHKVYSVVLKKHASRIGVRAPIHKINNIFNLFTYSISTCYQYKCDYPVKTKSGITIVTLSSEQVILNRNVKRPVL